MSVSTECGHEDAVVSRAARAWSWALLAVLLIGAFGGALLGVAPLQNWAMRVGLVMVLTGYVLLSRRSVRGTNRPVVAGLPVGAWSALLAIVAYALTAAAYAPLNHPLFGVHSMVSHWDQYVPTVPVFVVPYLGMFVTIFMTMGFLAFRQMHRQLRTTAVSFIIAMVVSETTFLLFQTEGTAQVRDAGSYGGIFGKMVEYVNFGYYKGNNFSTFPSMHVAYAVIFAIVWYRLGNRLWSTLMIIFSVTIIISTQVLHEHVLMDALYGSVVAVFGFSLAWFWLEYRPALKREREATVSGSA